MARSFEQWLAVREKLAERELLYGEHILKKQGLLTLTGDQVLEAVDMCLRSGRTVPSHLATLWCNRYQNYKTYKTASLDGAFDLSRKNEQLDAEQRYCNLVAPITWLVLKHKEVRRRQLAGNRKRTHKGITNSRYEDIAEELRRASPEFRSHAKRRGKASKKKKGFYITAGVVEGIYDRGREERPWLEPLLKNRLEAMLRGRQLRIIERGRWQRMFGKRKVPPISPKRKVAATFRQ